MKNLINKIKNAGAKTAFYLALPLALYGCNNDEPKIVKDVEKNKTVEEPNDSTEDYGTTYVLSEEEIEKISLGGHMIHSQEPLNYLKEGDIISAGVSEDIPYGMLRKVTRIFSDFTEIETRQATLEESIEEGTMEEYVSFTEQDIESTNMGRISKNSSGRGFALNYEGVVYDKDNNLSTKDDQVIVKGDLYFDLGTYTKLKIRNRKIREANIEVNFTGELSVELNSDLENISFNEEIKLGELNLSPFVMSIGVVPVVVRPELEFYVSAQGEIGSKLNSRIGDTFSASSYLSYLDGEWASGKSFSNEFNFEVNAEANASVKASAGPKLNLILYDVAGPSIRTDAYLELDANTNNNPWWELYGGLESKLGCDVSVLGKSLVNYEKTISDNRVRIADAGGPFPRELTAYFEVTPETGNTDTEFKFDASESPELSGETVAINYRWDWNSDGVYDTDYSLNPIEWKSFLYPGGRNITLEILNSQGERANFSRELFVEAGSGGVLDSLVIQPGPEGKDASIHLIYGSEEIYSGYGDREFLDVYSDHPISESNALIQFPIAGISENIRSAKLKLFGQGAFSDQNIIVRTHKVLSQWDESTFDEKNRPNHSYVSSSTLTDLIGWHEWDVTETVESWLNGEGNYGFMLSTNNNRPSGEYGFKSSDYPDPDKRPKLVIYYKKD